jgi:CTP:molybdopterin cytidylyltransferase MocA
MANNPITVTKPKGPWFTLPVGAGTLALTETASQAAAYDTIAITGKTLVHIRNSSTSVASTFTVTSVANYPDYRTGDITTYALAAQAAPTTANATAVFFVDIPGWQEADGTVWITCGHVADVIAAIPFN